MSLRENALAAARWTTTAAVVRLVLQVSQTALLARILEPSDFGLMAMAGTVTAFAAVFSDAGLSGALIHFPLPSRQILRRLFLLNLGVGLLLGCFVAALSGVLARIYNAPHLAPVVAALGLAFPINALAQQARSLAEKDLKFNSLAKIEIASVTGGFIAALGLAVANAGVFSLVGGILTTTLINSAANLTMHVARDSDDRSGPSTTQFILFGFHRLAEQFWNALRQQADLVIAAVFGTTHAVAFYATPRDYCVRVANTIVNPVVTRIAFPLMAGLQNDRAALSSIYLKALRFTASANFPLFAFVGCFPHETLLLLLGPKWEGAGSYLRIFAFWGLLRSTGYPSGSLLYAVGMVKRANAWNFGLLLATVPILWFVSSRHGLLPLAMCMLFLQVVIAFLTWRLLVLPATGIGLKLYTAHLAPPATASAIASFFSLAGAGIVDGGLRLPMGFVIFAGTYYLASLRLNREWLVTTRDLLRPALLNRRFGRP